MFTVFLNKILILILFMSIFHVGRHVWKIINILRDEDVPNKYEVSVRERILIGLSLAYILTTIFTGVTI